MREAGFTAVTLLGVMLAGGRAHAAPPGTRDAGAPAGAEAIEQAALAKLARADRKRLRACFQRELAIDPRLEEHMFTDIYAKPDGKVKDVHLLASEELGEAAHPDPPLSQKMAECLGAVIMKWTFPPTTWEGKVQLAEPVGVGGIRVTFAAKPPPGPKEHREAIRAVIRQHMAEMKGCYDAYLGRKGASQTPMRVMVEMTVKKGGLVTKALVTEPAKLEAKFETCVLDVARKMKLPEPDAGDLTVITYPFMFEPGR